MTSLLNIVLLLVLPGQYTSKHSEQEPHLETYCNQRFHFCSQFPSATLPTQLDFQNGDGLQLLTENKLATVTIAGYRGNFEAPTRDIHAQALKKIAREGERSVLISSLFGEDFYECFFLVGSRSFYHKSYLFDGYLVRLSIETTINQPKLMQELRENVTLYFPETIKKELEGTTSMSMTGRD